MTGVQTCALPICRSVGRSEPNTNNVQFGFLSEERLQDEHFFMQNDGPFNGYNIYIYIYIYIYISDIRRTNFRKDFRLDFIELTFGRAGGLFDRISDWRSDFRTAFPTGRTSEDGLERTGRRRRRTFERANNRNWGGQTSGRMNDEIDRTDGETTYGRKD